MSKLIVFNPSSLVQSLNPTPQPHPGVLTKLESLRSQGWSITIASNQSGGDWQEMAAKDLTMGAQFRVREDGKFIEDAYTVKAIDRSRLLKIETHTQYWLFGPEERLLVQSKTIESTIEHFSAVADVCGVREAVFCPVLDGEILYSLIYDSQWAWRSMMVIQKDCWKPGPGMLNYLKGLRIFAPKRCVIIGDQPRDRAAADAADFEFIDGTDWRADRVTVE